MSVEDRKDRVEAESDQTTGRVKEDLGKLTGNDRLENEGRVERAEGEMKEGINEATEAVRDAADDAKDTLGE